MFGEFIPPLSPLYLSPCFPTDMTTTWSKGTSGLHCPKLHVVETSKDSAGCMEIFKQLWLNVNVYKSTNIYHDSTNTHNPPPPGSPTQLFRGFKGCWCKGILKMIPKEFLGNHQSPTRVKLYIQWNLKDVSTQFPGTHQISTPVKQYIQGNVQGV